MVNNGLIISMNNVSEDSTYRRIVVADKLVVLTIELTE